MTVAVSIFASRRDQAAAGGLGGIMNETRKTDAARKAAGKAGTRHTRRFLAQIRSDVRLTTGLSVRVAIALTEFYNHEEGCAWPSQETLSERVSASRNSVGKTLKLLRELGHIEIERGSGLRNFNRYQLLLWSESGR